MAALLAAMSNPSPSTCVVVDSPVAVHSAPAVFSFGPDNGSGDGPALPDFPTSTTYAVSGSISIHAVTVVPGTICGGEYICVWPGQSAVDEVNLSGRSPKLIAHIEKKESRDGQREIQADRGREDNPLQSVRPTESPS
jgi:hypothetical protein